MNNNKKTNIQSKVDISIYNKIASLSVTDNRSIPNVIETILAVFFKENPNCKTISETRFKHIQISDYLGKYNDELLDRWTSGSKQDFTAFVSEFISKNDLQIEPNPKMFSEEDMMQFGDWCRNALLNTEFSHTRLKEHLQEWKNIKSVDNQ